MNAFFSLFLNSLNCICWLYADIFLFLLRFATLMLFVDRLGVRGMIFLYIGNCMLGRQAFQLSWRAIFFVLELDFFFCWDLLLRVPQLLHIQWCTFLLYHVASLLGIIIFEGFLTHPVWIPVLACCAAPSRLQARLSLIQKFECFILSVLILFPNLALFWVIEPRIFPL